MPTCLSTKHGTLSKKFKLTILVSCFPLFFFGQSLTGLWTGLLSNDSNTVRKDQSFEIALTEYKGKVYGYSRSEFIVNDILYYTVKRVKGVIDGDVCEVIDEEIVAFNFPGKIDKGVKVTSTFRRNNSDSTWYLAGTWKTNATKRYYSVSGKVDLAEEKDLTTSKIFPHLEELKLADRVAFYKDRKEGLPIVKIAKPERIKTEYTVRPDLTPSSPDKIAFSEPDLQKTIEKPVVADQVAVNTGPSGDIHKEEQESPPVKNNREVEKVDARDVAILPAASTDIVAVEKKDIKSPVVKTLPKQTMPVALENKTQPVEKKPAAVVVTKIPETKKPNEVVATRIPETKKPLDVVVTKVPDVKKPVEVVITKVPEIKKPIEEIIQTAVVIAGRKSEFLQEVNFRSDSLQLSLYDNGEIDGDTVSVFLNGEVMMAKQGLKASAIKKTIYIKPGQDDFTIVLFADNLGRYPPNTGLLVVHDGEDVYNLRFSSDFQKSTGIVFRKKK